jgi:hypothetical protein
MAASDHALYAVCHNAEGFARSQPYGRELQPQRCENLVALCVLKTITFFLH